MKEILIKEYNNTPQLNFSYKESNNTFQFNFLNGAFLEILGSNSKTYVAKFIDRLKDETIYEAEITNNMWTKPGIEYFINWRIEVYDKENDELVFEHNFDASGKRVYIHLESSALGDTLAWFPFIN